MTPISKNPPPRVLELKGLRAPASKKNRRQPKQLGGRMRWVPSDEAHADEKAIREAAFWAARGRTLFPDEDVSIEVVYHARSKTIDLRVVPLRPRPTGFAGRRRDLHGLIETVADALEGSAYSNDNQVAHVSMRRELD